MADDRLLAAIRRFWSETEVRGAYAAIFAAYHGRLESVTVIIGKATEGDSATGQVVVRDEDYLRWMDALEDRLREFEAEGRNEGPLLQGVEHSNFGGRYARS
jgi:hypothetical protein